MFNLFDCYNNSEQLHYQLDQRFSSSGPWKHFEVGPELFKKLLDLLKNSVSFVSLWLSLHFCVRLVVLTGVTMNDAAVFLLQRDTFHCNYSINSV